MAVSVPKRKSQKYKKVKVEDDHHQKKLFSEWVLCRIFNKINLTLILLFIVFLWSSSSTFITSSVVHVCVSSRKLNNLYCLSAGTQPANYSFPLKETPPPPPQDQQNPPDVDYAKPRYREIQMKAILSQSSKDVASPVLLKEIPPTQDQQNPPDVDSAKPRYREIQMKAILSRSNKDVASPVLLKEIPPTQDQQNPPDVDSAKPEYQETQMKAVLSRSSTDVASHFPLKETPPPQDQQNSPHVDSAKARYREIQTNAVLSRSSKEVAIDNGKLEERENARKNVEELLGVLRSYIPKSKPSDCDGRGIYVYDLPTKFNKDLLSQCKDMITWLDFCKHMSNDGMGEPISELGKDWYNTHQYSLEPIFHSHVLKHPCRVYEVEEAKLFYVPFYGGLDILRYHFKNVSIEVKDALSKELVEWLEHQKPWKRHFGMDHVFVLGKISWDFRRLENGSWGTGLLELDEMQHPMKLMIERQPWQNNDVGVPHPTYFHPSSDEGIIEWQSKIRGSHRVNLVSFAGTPRWPPKGIRSILIKQCTSAPNTCKFFDCRDQGCGNPGSIVRLFTESEFCLQPPGDSPTRKSVFDSLVAGCIPVVFDPFTAHYQYPWHLPEDYKKYSVYIDKEELTMSGGVNVIEKLMNISLKEREQMRKYIIDELMPRLVYSHPNAKLQRFEDAFSVAVNSLLEMAATNLP